MMRLGRHMWNTISIRRHKTRIWYASLTPYNPTMDLRSRDIAPRTVKRNAFKMTTYLPIYSYQWERGSKFAFIHQSPSQWSYKLNTDFELIEQVQLKLNLNYNRPSPLLADIVFFCLSLKVFKTRLLRKGFHTLIKVVSFSSQLMWDLTIHPRQGSASLLALVPFSNRCGTLTKSTRFGAQRPC